jgi:hypothetical protein
LLEFVFSDFKIYSSDKYPDLNFVFDGDTISLKSVLELVKL